MRVREGVSVIDDERAAAVGWHRAGGIPSLVLPEIGIEMSAGAVDVHEVRDEIQLRAHIEVVADAFGWQPHHLALVLSPKMLSETRWRGFVGYVDGAAAGSSQLVIDDAGTGGIYYVGVREAHRRRGIGEAMTAAAVLAARDAGCVRASLQASPMGQPIYERMGFREVAYYRQYLPSE